jgi:HD-GYP domain-containing protein (c-di-GMP phosphodiesterase class II)
MKLIPLSQVSSALHAGVTLPWGVRDGNGTLLLSRGHVLTDDRAVEVLLERGVYVDAAEVASVSNQGESAKQESMTVRWSAAEARLSTILKAVTDPLFLARLHESIVQIAALADGNVDLLIFLILRHDHSRPLNYGVVHSLHTAAICSLLSRRKSWEEAQRRSLIGAALTMNIAMLELQGSLAARAGRPSEAEQLLIQQHSTDAGALLRAAGLTDIDWLTAVEQHHEITGGTGYPNGVVEPTEMARMLRFVDLFLAKHSPRIRRAPQPAHKAARDLFTNSGGDPLAELIIKEFGIYPPGAYVKLASSEVAIVTQRGVTANAPIVMAITNKNGDPLSLPSRRDTGHANFKITATVDETLIRVRHSADVLYDISANR